MNQNHPTPFFNPSYTFHPQNPNPNFSYPFPPNPPPPPPPPPPPKPSSITNSLLPSTPNNLLTTLSNLKHFIDLAETTVNSVSDLLHSKNLPSSNEHFISCTFDSRHRMPPESLFRHSLRCPSSPGIIDLRILDSLHYPNSLKSEDQLRKENRFVQSLAESDADLCFSIDDYGDFGSNFFYKDCPSVYCSAELDSSKRTFTLPSVLSAHCANFVSSNVARESRECFGILPSDLLTVRGEVEGWNGYPHSYSLLVLQVVLGLQMIKESDSLKWVISNSPRYGIIIDAAMRDHIVLLLKLCLKAMSLEAYRSNELLMNEDVKERNGVLSLRSLSFNCPVLVEAMTWLASQLSVLYGEPNGMFFSINMLKHCILNAASSLPSFSSEKQMTQISASKEGLLKLDGNVGEMSFEIPGEEVIGNVKLEEPIKEWERENSTGAAKTSDCLVFVSQIAAAIAALRERSLLEEKIKGLRVVGSLSKSQRLTEHSYVTMRADEERSKRSTYKPILEHDGLLWHRSRDQDSNKNKTREELMAEERDYKRRRMSYRGKKVKRSTKEVMRDIIEKHMEEIKQAGGIGCFVKGSVESGVFPQVQERQRRTSHGHHEDPKDQHKSSRNEKRDREYTSKSPEKYRSHRRSHEKHRHQREHDERARSNYDKYDSVSPQREIYRDSRSFSSVSNPSTDVSDRKYDQMSKSKDQYRGRIYGSRRSESVTQTMFEDRYDPSDGRYEDAYDVREDKLYSLNDDKYRDEKQRIGNTEKERYHNHPKKS